MPQPPNPSAQLLEGRGPAGEEGRGCHATQNGHCSKDTSILESQGEGRAQHERREKAAAGEKACGPGLGR